MACFTQKEISNYELDDFRMQKTFWSEKIIFIYYLIVSKIDLFDTQEFQKNDHVAGRSKIRPQERG